MRAFCFAVGLVALLGLGGVAQAATAAIPTSLDAGTLANSLMSSTAPYYVAGFVVLALLVGVGIVASVIRGRKLSGGKG